MLKQCPKCGYNQLYAAIEVKQEWQTDILGHWHIAGYNRTRPPDEDDNWTCLKCHYTASGHEFVK